MLRAVHPHELPEVDVLVSHAEQNLLRGMALSRLLLPATRLDLSAQPVGQVLDLPGPRAALAALLGVVGAPQMLLRVGVGSRPVTTARRPLTPA